jgi:maltose/moltooligosaccharide transporter
VVFTLIDVLEPKILPIMLKQHEATNEQIAVIVGTINALMQMIVMPPLGYCSDRTRTRWGRRIPYLAWVTPFATLFLVLTPFAPEIANWAAGAGWLGGWARHVSVPPVILVFGILVVAYRGVQSATNCMFFGLMRDVVPTSHMGRFIALFRVFGAAGTFIVSYWLVGRALTDNKAIFIGIAALNLVGFLAICWFVKEGDYPPVEDAIPAERGSPPLARLVRATRNFFAESFTHPIYLWTYFMRVCVYAAFALQSFIIFFPRFELGMSLDRIGKLLSWSAVAWIAIAYPVGRLVDSLGSIRVLWHGLLLLTAAYVASFFMVVGDATFFISSFVTGLCFWVVMLCVLKHAQEIFHPIRYSQLAGASTIVQSVAIAFVISPAAGAILDHLKDWHHVLEVPGIGAVALGPYRLVNLMLGGLYGLAWLGLIQMRTYWRLLGGQAHYVAPI